MMTLLSDIPDYPITVIKAGAGYGKTTAVGSYVQQSGLQSNCVTITADEPDGVRFVEKLLHACLPRHIPEQELERTLAAAHSPLSWITSSELAADLVNAYVHQESILVIDDFHTIDEDTFILNWMDTWLGRLPVNLHVVIVTRTNPSLQVVEQRQLRDEVLIIRERDLAFTEDEIGFLFHPSQHPEGPNLERSQIRWLLQRTRGMAMVLSMLLRDWRQYGSFARLQSLLDERTSIHEQVGQLFIHDLRSEQRDFIRNTSILSSLTSDLCNAVLNRTDSQAILREMDRRGSLVLEDDGQTYSVHPLVREYFVRTTSSDVHTEVLLKAIQWHLGRGEDSRAIGYLFLLEDETMIGAALIDYIPRHLERGQVSTVQGWLERLSHETITRIPDLLWAKGEVFRHTNQFTNALYYYRLARDRALVERNHRLIVSVEIACARLYLDTIQPASASLHIREALRYVHKSDRVNRYTILEISFENAINSGRLVRAHRLHRFLTITLGDNLPNNNSDARLLLRTGRIREVVRDLKPRIATDHTDHRSALSHREATLLLSLMYVMMGDVERAKEQAIRGHSVGNYLHAPFVSAVGFIRLGHAQHLENPLGTAALHSYQRAVAQMDELDVPRGKAEAFLGLCLAHGYQSQFALARFYAQEGIAVAERAGDVWMANLIRLGLGQICVELEAYEQAIEELSHCENAFSSCGDEFLRTSTLLLRSVARAALGDTRFHDDLAAVLSSVQRNDIDFLVTKSTFAGLRDVQRLVPLLQAHRLHGAEPRSAARILHQLDAGHLEYHPGYTLRVKTLGHFTAWRGFKEITRRDWQREKAKLLFQFLLTYRGTLFHREEICDRLWGDSSPEVAERDFKVSLNVLSLALEPHKPGRGPSMFIERQGGLYGLTAHSTVWVDRDEFAQKVLDAQSVTDVAKRCQQLGSALELYEGDYLPDLRYEAWTDGEREKVRCLFLQGCIQFAESCFSLKRYDDVIAICERASSVEPTWEDAYLWLMRTYSALDNRSMVIHTYRNCERIMAQELGVPPMASTRSLYEEMIGKGCGTLSK